MNEREYRKCESGREVVVYRANSWSEYGLRKSLPKLHITFIIVIDYRLRLLFSCLWNFIVQVRLTDGTLSNVLSPQISDADVQTSRQRISSFLSTCTAYELLPESGKVWNFYHQPIILVTYHLELLNLLIQWHLATGYYLGCWSACETGISHTAWAGIFLLGLKFLYWIFKYVEWLC